MNLQAMRFRIGVFVLFAILLLAILIVLFGSFPKVFRRDHEYIVLFRNATGVESGTPVRRSGVRVGDVKSIELDDEHGVARVVIRIGASYVIHRNDQATLIHGLISGDTSIDLAQRRTPDGQVAADSTPVDPGTELTGVEAADVSTVLNQAQDVVPTTRETLSDIRKSLQQLERLTPLTESLLKEYTELAKETRRMVPELAETNRQVQGLTKDVRSLVPEVRKTNSELELTNQEIQITAKNWGRLGERLDVLLQTNQDKFVKVVDQMNDTLSRLSNVFNETNQRRLSDTLKNVQAGSENLGSIAKNTDDLLKESKKTLTQINDSLTRTNEVLDNVQKATKPIAERSGSIVKNLDDSTAKLNAVLTDARDLIRAIGASDGTLHKLLSDPSLYNNLDKAAAMVTHMLPRLEHALKDFETFADKLARQPEKIGLGGVFHPSSGLKPMEGDK